MNHQFQCIAHTPFGHAYVALRGSLEMRCTQLIQTKFVNFFYVSLDVTQKRQHPIIKMLVTDANKCQLVLSKAARSDSQKTLKYFSDQINRLWRNTYKLLSQDSLTEFVLCYDATWCLVQSRNRPIVSKIRLWWGKPILIRICPY